MDEQRFVADARHVGRVVPDGLETELDQNACQPARLGGVLGGARRSAFPGGFRGRAGSRCRGGRERTSVVGVAPEGDVHAAGGPAPVAVHVAFGTGRVPASGRWAFLGPGPGLPVRRCRPATAGRTSGPSPARGAGPGSPVARRVRDRAPGGRASVHRGPIHVTHDTLSDSLRCRNAKPTLQMILQGYCVSWSNVDQALACSRSGEPAGGRLRGATSWTVLSIPAAVLLGLRIFVPTASFASAHTTRHALAKVQSGAKPSEQSPAHRYRTGIAPPKSPHPRHPTTHT